MSSGEYSLARRIRNLRLEKNISQAQLASRAGMLPAQLCKIESGRNRLNGSTLSRVAAALDVSISCLLGENGDRLPTSRRERRPDDAVCEGSYVPVLMNDCFSKSELVGLSEVREWERIVAEAEERRGVSVQTVFQLSYPYGMNEQAADLVAREVRSSLGMGREPALNLTATLERVGVRIVKIRGPYNFKSASFYNCKRRTLSIALSANDTPERNNFRIACELGAAVAFAVNGYSPVEDVGEVHRFIRRFAAAFLMPEECVRAEVSSLGLRPEDWTMETLVFVKERFGVSAESFALRLETLGLIKPLLRNKLRDGLRARYAAKPEDMEPHAAKGLTRLDILMAIKKGRSQP